MKIVFQILQIQGHRAKIYVALDARGFGKGLGLDLRIGQYLVEYFPLLFAFEKVKRITDIVLIKRT